MPEITIECFYCGIICEGTGTRDHFIPRATLKKYFPHNIGSWSSNKVYACRACNSAKKDLSFEQFKSTDYYRKNCLSNKWRGIVLRVSA